MNLWATADFETITPDWRKILKLKPHQQITIHDINHYYFVTENPIFPEVYLWSLTFKKEDLKRLKIKSNYDVDITQNEEVIKVIGISIRDFFGFLSEQKRTWDIYFHNLKKFDGHFLLPMLIKLGFGRQLNDDRMFMDERVDKIITDNNFDRNSDGYQINKEIHQLQVGEFNYMVERGKQIYNIKWRIPDNGENYKTRKSRRFINFKDNLLMFTTSVEEMGRQVADFYIKNGMSREEAIKKYHKGSINYIRSEKYTSLEEAKQDKQVYEYVGQDTYIVFAFRKMMIEIINPIFESKKWGMTAGATAVNHWKELFGNKLLKTKANEVKVVNEKAGGKYYIYNRKKYFLKKIHDVLIQEILPTKWLDWEYKDSFIFMSIYKWYVGGLTMVNEDRRGIVSHSIAVLDIVSSYPTIMNSDYPCPIGMPISNGNYKLFDVHVFKELYNDKGLPFVSINNGNSREWRRRIYAGTTLKLTSVSLPYFKKYYNVKPGDIIVEQRYSFKTVPFKKLFGDYIKLWYELKDKAKHEDNDFLKGFTKIMLNSLYGKFATKKLHEGYTWDEEEDSFVEHNEQLQSKFYLPIALAITERARLRLVDAVGEDYDQFCYSDTDSIFITWALYEKIKQEKRIEIGDRLGDWELENKHPYVFFPRRAKQYCAFCEIGGKECEKCKKPAKMAFAGIDFLKYQKIWSDDLDDFTTDNIKIRDSLEISDFIYGKTINNQLQPKQVVGWGVLLYEQEKSIKPVWDYTPFEEQHRITKEDYLTHPNNLKYVKK